MADVEYMIAMGSHVGIAHVKRYVGMLSKHQRDGG